MKLTQENKTVTAVFSSTEKNHHVRRPLPYFGDMKGLRPITEYHISTVCRYIVVVYKLLLNLFGLSSVVTALVAS